MNFLSWIPSLGAKAVKPGVDERSVKRPGFSLSGMASGATFFATNAFDSILAKLPGYNAEKRVGNLLRNSSFASTLKAMSRMLTDAEVCVQRREPGSKGGKWKNDASNRLADLLQRPNDHFDSTLLLDAISISYILDGNAYIYKARNEFGEVVELWPLPHYAVTPRRLPDSGNWVDFYEYRIGSGKAGVEDIDPRDIIHIRDGVDPENDLLGWSAVKAAIRSICTENEAIDFVNALLHNCGIPSVIISPKNDDGEFDEAQGKMIRQTWKEKFGGNRRGEAWVQSIPLDVKVLGFDPKTLDMAAIRKIAQSDIAASIGIPAVVVGLLVGLETSTAKASYEEALWQAYVACVVPMLKRIASQLTAALVGDKDFPFGVVGKMRVWFDLSEVSCLGEDQNKLSERLGKLWELGVIKLSEIRNGLGFLMADDDEDGYKWQLVKAPANTPPNAPTPDALPQPSK